MENVSELEDRPLTEVEVRFPQRPHSSAEHFVFIFHPISFGPLTPRTKLYRSIIIIPNPQQCSSRLARVRPPFGAKARQEAQWQGEGGLGGGRGGGHQTSQFGATNGPSITLSHSYTAEQSTEAGSECDISGPECRPCRPIRCPSACVCVGVCVCVMTVNARGEETSITLGNPPQSASPHMKSGMNK